MSLVATALGTDLGIPSISGEKSVVSKKFSFLSPCPKAHRNSSAPGAEGMHKIPPLGIPLYIFLRKSWFPKCASSISSSAPRPKRYELESDYHSILAV